MHKRPSISVGQAVSAPNTIISFLTMIPPLVLNTITSGIIQKLYPDRPIVPDFLFDVFGYIGWLEYVTDPLVWISALLLILYMFSQGRDRMPFLLNSIGLLYLVRGVLQLLTPLGRPTGNLDSYGVLKVFNVMQHGMFPSGHVAFSFLVFLVIDKERAPVYKIVAGISSFLMVVTTLLSRGHYSIDMAGGLMLGFIVYTVLKDRGWFYEVRLRKPRR
jgi:membrane-associated phospholipid phosphatase